MEIARVIARVNCYICTNGDAYNSSLIHTCKETKNETTTHTKSNIQTKRTTTSTFPTDQGSYCTNRRHLLATAGPTRDEYSFTLDSLLLP